MKKHRQRYRQWLCVAILCVLVMQTAGTTATAHAEFGPIEKPSNIVSDYIRRGEELRRKWDLEAAGKAFREAVRLEPKSLDARLGLARIARVRLQYSQSLNLLDNAAKEHPDNASLLCEYGSLYLAVEEPERAYKYFERVSSISENNSATIGLAAVDVLRQDYDRAVTALIDWLRRGKDDGSANALLARALLESHKENEAAEAAERALSLDPYNVEALLVLAYVKSIIGKADESKELARRVVSLDPFNFAARRVFSQYLDGQRGYEQKVSEQARLHYLSGKALKREGKLDKAFQELEAALGLEPRYYRALIGVADICLKRGDFVRAASIATEATLVDPEGAVAQLELSCAHRGINERSRIEIGAADFAALHYNGPATAAYAITRQIFPEYDSLTRRQRVIIDASVGPLSAFLPRLARSGGRHHLLSFDQRPGELPALKGVGSEKTFDGRYYASLRGVGGRIAVSGVEYLEQAANGGFNTIAHEFAHQVHLVAFGKGESREIRQLYDRARLEGRFLDYYAAANEHEYFAQGYEAFISDRKRPLAGVTGRHTRHELLAVDPALYRFLEKLIGEHRSSVLVQ
jgi:Tfp pilus assembly protein PilF